MRILLAGASGLVGGAVLERALGDARVDRVFSLARRPSGLAHPKLIEWLAPEGDLLAGLRPEPVDAVLCCLGTTIGKVGGDRSAFMRVDKDLVLGLARWAKAQGVPAFAVVSAIGADAGSAFFYNRVKGEMEQGLRAMGIPELHIFQPSILTGPRKEKRIGERIGIAAARLLAPLLPDRYKPMPHDVLARALLNCIGTPGGTRAHGAIVRLAGQG